MSENKLKESSKTKKEVKDNSKPELTKEEQIELAKQEKLKEYPLIETRLFKYNANDPNADAVINVMNNNVKRVTTSVKNESLTIWYVISLIVTIALTVGAFFVDPIALTSSGYGINGGYVVILIFAILFALITCIISITLSLKAYKNKDYKNVGLIYSVFFAVGSIIFLFSFVAAISYNTQIKKVKLEEIKEFVDLEKKINELLNIFFEIQNLEVNMRLGSNDNNEFSSTVLSNLQQQINQHKIRICDLYSEVVPTYYNLFDTKNDNLFN